jgi:glycosyltransferase involved in cell wall biosynthesis
MRSNPRVCILVPSHWSAVTGGAEMQVAMLVRRLVAQQHCDVHYIARRSGRDYVPEGYTLHRLEARKMVAGTLLLEVPPLLKLLRHVQPDVIYQRVACAYTGAAAWFAKSQRRRLVWHVSSDRDLTPVPWSPSLRSPLEQISKRMVTYGARHADTVVVQNAAQVELLERLHGRADGLHIPNFHAVPAAFAPKSFERLTVCWVGNVKELKQPEIFLRLAADLGSRANVEFVMAGMPQMAERDWQKLETRMRALPNLKFLGQIPQDAVNELLTRAHLLVNTSTVEGFPNTFIQGWLREVPVLSLNVNPDGCLDGTHCGICAEGSYEALRSSLERLLDDADLRNTMGQRSGEYARKHFSEDNLETLTRAIVQPAGPR